MHKEQAIEILEKFDWIAKSGFYEKEYKGSIIEAYPLVNAITRDTKVAVNDSNFIRDKELLEKELAKYQPYYKFKKE